MITDLSKINIATKALKKADTIYIIGNGGSASLADHLACDLIKNAKRKAIALTNFSIGSAIANDYGTFGVVFLKQLENLFSINKDVLICISTSGESENLITAAKYISEKGGTVLSILGTIEDNEGGYLRNYSTIPLIIGTDDQQECEDIFSEICHKLYKNLI